jgi:hypothetical protein
MYNTAAISNPGRNEPWLAPHAVHRRATPNPEKGNQASAD